MYPARSAAPTAVSTHPKKICIPSDSDRCTDVGRARRRNRNKEIRSDSKNGPATNWRHTYHAALQRDATRPVAAVRSISASSNPSPPYGCELSSVPSGRATAGVVGDPVLAQFKVATWYVFSAARHNTAFS